MTQAEVVVFHSALGLRPALIEWAQRVRAAGYTVHTPDLFDGEVFATLEEGAAKRDAIGVPELMRRAAASVEDLEVPVVYAGFSMGAAAAEFLAATRSNAQGALLMHGAVAIDVLGVVWWPPAVAVQVHYAESDPWVDRAAVDALTSAARAAGARAEVYTYPGSGHLFADCDLADHDSSSAALMLERALAFIATAADRM